MRDPVMEELSDKVRRGEPISFLAAIAVVNYQEHLRREREAAFNATLRGRIVKWFRSWRSAHGGA